SHLWLPGIRNRFLLDKRAFAELFGFGQWILLSSAMTFAAGEGNKLLVGGFLGIKLLAFFTLANTMSLVFFQVTQQLNSYVLFPAYSEVVRERPERLASVARRSRLLLIVPGWTIALVFVFWGKHL